MNELLDQFFKVPGVNSIEITGFDGNIAVGVYPSGELLNSGSDNRLKELSDYYNKYFIPHISGLLGVSNLTMSFTINKTSDVTRFLNNIEKYRFNSAILKYLSDISETIPNGYKVSSRLGLGYNANLPEKISSTIRNYVLTDDPTIKFPLENRPIIKPDDLKSGLFDFITHFKAQLDFYFDIESFSYHELCKLIDENK